MVFGGQGNYLTTLMDDEQSANNKVILADVYVMITYYTKQTMDSCRKHHSDL